MKGNPQVLQQLNNILRHQLTTINQYFLHSRMLDHIGLSELGSIIYKQSITEMKSADKIIERILLLDGLPNLQDLGKLLIGETAVEMINCDLKAETAKHQDLIEAIAHCEQHQDYVTRELLTKTKDDNEEHIDFLDTQLELVASMGLANYLQSMAD